MTYHSRNIEMQLSKKHMDITSFAGLSPLIKMCEMLDVRQMIDENIGARGSRGCSDADQVMSAVLLNIVGGDAVDHLDMFRDAFMSVGLVSRVPSVTACRNYAAEFHVDADDACRGQGRAFIPTKNEHIAGLDKVHAELFATAFKHAPRTEITLDQDATFIETKNADALYSFKKTKSYQALNLYCPEYDMMVATDYRDGNVPPGMYQLEQLERALDALPDGITKIKFRSDSAGYQADLLKFLNKRKIDFAVSCDVTREFRAAAAAVPESDWRPLNDYQEWAEVVYAPNSLSTSKNGGVFRFIAIREFFAKADPKDCEAKSRQRLLPGMIDMLESQNDNIKKLHLTDMYGNVYKVFGVVTNMEETDGAELIRWHRGRCGKSEEIHRILKDDLAGGHVISRRLGANAFWWHCAVLAHSLCTLLKRLLPQFLRHCRPKTLRAIFFTTVGRIVHHARRVIIRVNDTPSGRLVVAAYERARSMIASAG